MGDPQVDLVLEMFRRFSEGGLESALDLISEDASFEVPGDMSAEPDVYEGHDGARRYFAGFEGLMEDVRFEPQEFERNGEAITVWMRFSGRGTTSGIEVEQFAAVNIWVADGQVQRMRPYLDMDSAREALR